MKKTIFIFLCLFSSVTFAWSSMGHRIVAALAYSELTPVQKSWVAEHLYHNPHYSLRSTMMRASSWADKIKFQGVKKYNAWHYINIPHSKRTPVKVKADSPNVVTAINRCSREMNDPSISQRRKAFCLRMLIHLVADAHQPMHCVTLYSHKFRYGDSGGNAYKIQSRHANNLHQYWDQGVGLFPYMDRHTYRRRTRQLIRRIQKKYPPAGLVSTDDSNVKAWVKQCHQLAIKYAYTLPMYEHPDASYNAKGREVVLRQLALAGHRLAKLIAGLSQNT